MTAKRIHIDMGNKLHIGFCANEKYIPYVCVAVRSIANTFSGDALAHIHLFTDRIGKGSIKRLQESAADTPNISIEIHEVDDTQLRDLKQGKYTIYTWYRVLIPDILKDVSTILYLDTDVCVADDLSQLAEMDLEGSAVAVPHDTDTYTDPPFIRCGYPKELGYFCAGVMMMNLDFWRKNDISRQVTEWARLHEDALRYPDQDSINYVCRNAKRYLPLRYGVTKSVFAEKWFYTPEFKSELLESLEHPAVIHYAGCAPWHRESDHPFADIWRSVNASLQHPAPITTATKGLLGLKIRIWKLLNPHRSGSAISPEEIRARIGKID